MTTFKLLCLLLVIQVSAFAQKDLTRYVDPFIGTGGHGHTYPGPLLPFGMIQLSPDTRLTGWDGCSGYHYSDQIIYGFSHTHLSGTGISDYGDILLMPTVGEVYLNATNNGQTDKGYASRFNHRDETASPGYYAVKLEDDNIKAELTATNRAGIHRYTFPSTNEANIILDLNHRDRVLDSGLTITGPNTISGWRRSTAWAKDQVVYFVAEFSQPFTSFGVSLDDRAPVELKEVQGKNLKAFFRFDARSHVPVIVKLAISAVSIDGARKNFAAEIMDADFDTVRNAAVKTWNTALGKIEIKGGNEAQLKTFYTALYHAMSAPNLYLDVDGQYRGHDFKTHQANGFDYYTVFSLWDTFRAAHPLYTIIEPKRTADFIKTFLAQYEQGGRLPVWELAANETDTMIGYHAVSVIADAIMKGIKGFDQEEAFAAMKHSAELKHFGLDVYMANGYIGMEDEKESVSKTLEYAYDDWCIAQVAQLLGHKDDYQRYLDRAQAYKNVFDPESGFMRPRTNGGWLTPFDPREVSFSFTEANSWQYSFFVPQDISGLIKLQGGPQRFTSKLDQLFSVESSTTGREQADITGLIGQYAHGNEPSHHMAYLYDYVGQPWKTAARVRQVLDNFYKPEPDGLIGNEDCGQMSAWYVLSAAGFYPVTPGSPIYAIGSPIFPEVRFKLENGQAFVIRAQGVSEKNIYIQSVRLNGKPYDKSYFTHADLLAGGELVFEMGPQPNERWASGAGDLPVSEITGTTIVPVPVIKASGKTFKDRLELDLCGLNKELTIRYTTDGAEPGPQSLRFSKPFSLDQTTTVKAIAVNQSGRKSQVVSASYIRIPHDWSITLLAKYSNQYPGGGDLALIDGIRGTKNWSGGAWQGYVGQDLVAIVDLGKTQKVSKVGAGFLQDIGSWIWLPRSVSFEFSLDGKEFGPAASVPNDVPENQYGVVVKDFTATVKVQNARYIRVRAVNFGKIPSWHAGAGGDAWIFADEIWLE